MRENRLVQERQTHALPIGELTIYLHGGEEAHERHVRAIEMLKSDPILAERDYSQYDLSRSEARERALAKVHRLLEIRPHINEEQFWALFFAAASLDPSLSWRFAIHQLLFIGAIRGQGTPKPVASSAASA